MRKFLALSVLSLAILAFQPASACDCKGDNKACKCEKCEHHDGKSCEHKGKKECGCSHKEKAATEAAPAPAAPAPKK